MDFKEQLEKIKELGFNPLDIMIANELEQMLEVEELETTEDEFELACDLIKEAYLNSEEAPIIYNYIIALFDLLEEGNELEELWYYDIINKLIFSR
jgi:hypothetical protein